MIRALDPAADRPAVAALLTRAQDYYQLWLGRPPGPAEVEDVFTDGPPGCDPAASQRLGLFLDGTLNGVAELSFGFPTPPDAYLGLMILAPDARSQGHGAAFLANIESRARAALAPQLYLAVLQANPRGAAFWARMGFHPTGVSRFDADTGHTSHRLVKPL
ncbi:GNAT family N-acetyltransferase [Tabrizicola sp. WMC-M-20]|nr:GNAT family N-acetyltransferase [Tabrizicola sp. WMC-M-20]